MALVKICGLKTIEAAQKAIDSGADMLGMILVPGRARTVDNETAIQIIEIARDTRERRNRSIKNANQLLEALVKETNGKNAREYQEAACRLIAANGPFVVGVFRNQPEDEVFSTAEKLGLDFVQLHGKEDKLSFLNRNAQDGRKYGIIPRFVVPHDAQAITDIFLPSVRENGAVVALLDSEGGGEGKVIDWNAVGDLESGSHILAGGLTPENVTEALKVNNVAGVDVSGGVETDGVKDLDKIERFVIAGKNDST